MKRFALMGLALAALTGCGSEDEEGEPIPAAQAAELQKRLDSVENRFNFGGGACNDIADDERRVARTIEGLPANVDPDVRQALEDSFSRLFELTSEQCDEQKGQDTETETTPETETQTETETTPETDTTPTETEPETDTTPTEPEPAPTEPEPAPEPEGSGGTGGNGGNGGNGGAGAPEGGE